MLLTILDSYQDVERMDKFVASMTKKTLNGPTPLDSKWKELTDQQEVGL